MKECKGIYFRSKVTTYSHNGSYVQKRILTLLKRISCKGCGHCDYEKELLNIAASEGDYYPNIDQDYIYKVYAEDEYELGFKKVGKYYIEHGATHRKVKEFS